MEVLLIASLFGACIRVAMSHDERDRVTRQLLEPFAERPDVPEPTRAFRPPRFFPQEASMPHWKMFRLMEYLEVMHLPYEAVPWRRQASLLARCAAKKWLDFDLRVEEPAHAELKLTPDGHLELLHLRAVLPLEIPDVRLLSR